MFCLLFLRSHPVQLKAFLRLLQKHIHCSFSSNDIDWISSRAYWTWLLGGFFSANFSGHWSGLIKVNWPPWCTVMQMLALFSLNPQTFSWGSFCLNLETLPHNPLPTRAISPLPTYGTQAGCWTSLHVSSNSKSFEGFCWQKRLITWHDGKWKLELGFLPPARH